MTKEMKLISKLSEKEFAVAQELSMQFLTADMGSISLEAADAAEVLLGDYQLPKIYATRHSDEAYARKERWALVGQFVQVFHKALNEMRYGDRMITGYAA